MLLAAWLLAATAGQLGNGFDMGGPSMSLAAKGAQPAGDGFVDTTNNMVAYRFTAHQASAVSTVGLAVAAINSGTTSFMGNPFEYFVDICAADVQGQLTDVSGDGNCSYFFGELPVGNLTANSWVSVGYTSFMGSTATALTPGATYFVVIQPFFMAGPTTFAPAVGPTSTSVDPVSGALEPFPRDVWYGTATNRDMTLTLTDTGFEPLFYVVYAAADPNPGTCTGATLEDGTPYFSSAGPADNSSPQPLNHGQSMSEDFMAGAILAESGLTQSAKIFAIEIPVQLPANPPGGELAPQISLAVEDGGTFGFGAAAPVGATFAAATPMPLTWQRAFITSAARGSATLSSSSGMWSASLSNPNTGGPAIQAWQWASQDDKAANVCTAENRTTFLGGYSYASVLRPDGSTPPGISMPFRLCASRDPTSAVPDQDCGHDDGGPSIHVCRDADQDGFGDPSDSLDISQLAYATNLPPGYVANCTDCDDQDPTVPARCLVNVCTGADSCLTDGGCLAGAYDPGALYSDGGATQCALSAITLTDTGDPGVCSGAMGYDLSAALFNGYDAGFPGSGWSFVCDGGVARDVGQTGATATAQVCAAASGNSATCWVAFGSGISNVVTLPFGSGSTASVASSGGGSTSISTTASNSSSLAASSGAVGSSGSTAQSSSRASTGTGSRSTAATSRSTRSTSASSSTRGSGSTKATSGHSSVSGSGPTSSGASAASRGSSAGASRGSSSAGSRSAASSTGSASGKSTNSGSRSASTSSRGSTGSASSARVSSARSAGASGTESASSGTGASAAGSIGGKGTSGGGSTSVVETTSGSSAGRGPSSSGGSRSASTSASGSPSGSGGSTGSSSSPTPTRESFRLGGCGCTSTDSPTALVGWVGAWLALRRRRRPRSGRPS